MGRFKPKRRGNRRYGKRNGGTPFLPVAVFPMAVNFRFTSTALTHDVHPKALVSNADNTWRASSTFVTFASDDVAVAQIVLFSSNASQLTTMTFDIGPTPKRIRIRAPRTLDYCTADSTWWRYIVSKPNAIVSGIATFTLKESLDTVLTDLNSRDDESDISFENIST